MTQEISIYVESLKAQVINSAISAESKDEICRYLGRALQKKQSEGECKQLLDRYGWPGTTDAQALQTWWSNRREVKNNGHKSQRKQTTPKVPPFTADDALALIQKLAQAQGVSVAELRKQLNSDMAAKAKQKHDELLQAAREAQNALQMYRDEWAEVINECARMQTAYDDAVKAANDFATANNLK